MAYPIVSRGSTTMHSCIYEGTVHHRRYLPVSHTIRFPLFLIYVDLSEMETIFGRRGFWSTRQPCLAHFRRQDYLGDPQRPLADSVRALVSQELGWCPVGPIRLLTHFRYFGIQINPVSFYYCFDQTGERLQALVAEVTNTPWKERHCYVLDCRSQSTAPYLTFSTAKALHVSPFLKMEMEYYWKLTVPRERLTVQIANQTASGRPFDATLVVQRRPLSRWHLTRILIQYPFLTLQVILAIYWHAFRLWLKRIPFVPHPRTSRLQSIPQRDDPAVSIPRRASRVNTE